MCVCVCGGGEGSGKRWKKRKEEAKQNKCVYSAATLKANVTVQPKRAHHEQ